MKKGLKLNAVCITGGMLFGLGLGLSQMARPEVVLNFLQLKDLGLLVFLLTGAVSLGLLFETAVRKNMEALITGQKLGKRVKDLDRRVVFGGVVFGIGWGISGICPGAAYASVGIGNFPALVAIAGMLLGAYTQGVLRENLS